MSQEPQAKPKTTLMERVDDRIKIWEAIAQMDGEVSAFIEGWLAKVEKDLAVKVDSYKFMQDELESEAERLKAEAKKLSGAARTMESLVDGLKSRVKLAMEKMCVDEVKGTLWRYTLQNTAPALLVDPAQLPAEFKMVVTELVPDRERIKPLLELGQDIPGCELKAGKALRVYVVKGAKK